MAGNPAAVGKTEANRTNILVGAILEAIEATPASFAAFKTDVLARIAAAWVTSEGATAAVARTENRLSNF